MMNFLKKQYKVILFVVTLSMTLQLLILMHIFQLTRMIENFDPVVIEYVQRVEAKEPETVSVPPRITCPLDDETQQMILEKTEEHGIDFAFTMGIIYTESRFQPEVISSGGDYGLMQINKVNHEWLSETLGLTDFLDPEQNVTAGLYILDYLFDRYENPAQVLMAYNMGEGGAKKYWDKGIYTSDYAEKVLQQAEIYRQEINERMGENGQM